MPFMEPMSILEWSMSFIGAISFLVPMSILEWSMPFMEPMSILEWSMPFMEPMSIPAIMPPMSAMVSRGRLRMSGTSPDMPSRGDRVPRTDAVRPMDSAKIE